MKLLPLLLLNLATVGVGIVAYDQLREDATQGAVVDGARSESAALEPRIEALEADRRPILRGANVDAQVLERLKALEEALREQDATRSAGVTEAVADDVATEADPASPAAKPDEPTADEMRRWCRVRDAVKREESIRKNHARFDKALDKLSIGLTPRQREKIYAAHAAFEPRIGEIWGEVKQQAQATLAAGGTVNRGEIMATTMAVIQQEFAEALTGVVHAADAQIVAEAMLPGRK